MHQSPFETMLVSNDIVPLLRDTIVQAGAILDMQGWDGVAFVVLLGVVDIETDFKVEEDSDAAMGTPTDITGALITQLLGADDNKFAIVDVWRPTERYVRGELTTGNGVLGNNTAVVALRYRGQGRFPVTQGAAELVKIAAN